MHPDLRSSDKYLREHTPQGIDDIIATRREFLARTGMGFGGLSLAALFGLNVFDASAAVTPSSMANPLAPKNPHFKVKAKHVIHIFAEGAPSHVDTWDPKPSLAQYDGKTIPGHEGVAMASPFKFTKR